MPSRIGFAQFCPEFGNPSANRRRMEAMAAKAAGASADLLVFPELATSGYEFRDRSEVERLAESSREEESAAFAKEIASRHNMTVVIGYPEESGGRLYNSCLLATPSGELTNYRKIHLFSRETELFDPGDAPPPVVETPAGRVGLMICFDWLFPETARLLALAGAEIIAHPSNLVMAHCQRAMFARCVENRLFAVTTNRYGVEERAGRRLVFTGASQILGPEGELLAAAPEEGDCMEVVEADLSRARRYQINDENHLLEDRRVDLYGALLKAQA